MLLTQDILLPSRPGVIKRLLEQGLDGTFLYSCFSSEDSKKRTEEIWLFEISTEKNSLIYINDRKEEIITASLNPDRNVIAFTTFAGINRHLPEKSNFETQNKSNLESGIPHWTIPPNSYQYNEEDGTNVSDHDKRVAGRYASYVAGVYPSTWINTFTTEGNAYQRVVFTNCCASREMDGCQITENRLLFIMHRSKVGLYSVYLENKTNGSKHKIQLHSAPRGVLIVKKVFWSQWDPLRQLLYYVVVNKKKNYNEDSNYVPYTYTTTLCCVEFTEHRFQQKIFVCPIGLGIDHDILTTRDSFHVLDDMNPTVSSPSVNMRVLRLENGTMCLCWQSTTSETSGTFYKIAVLSKDILLHCNTEKAFGNVRLSFTTFGNNILVHSPVTVKHVLAIDALCPDPWNFSYHCHYITNASELEKLTSITELPYCIPQSINNRQKKCQCYIFDKNRKVISGIRIDRKSVASSFFSQETSFENKIAIARFCAIGFHNDDVEETTRYSFFKEFLQSFFDKGIILKGDKILATLIIHMVANEVCGEFWQVESLLRNLLPMAINMSQYETRDFTLRVGFTQHSDEIGAQISKVMEKCDHTMLRWKKAENAFKCGNFVPFDLQSIHDDIRMLHEQFGAKQSQVQKSEQEKASDPVSDYQDLQNELAMDIESDEGLLNCFSSFKQDYFCENVVALIYHKLSEHLKKYISDEVSVSSIARRYSIATLHAASHLIHLVLRLLEIDEHDRPLFSPVQSEERNLLRFLKQLLSACVSLNFPLLPGFQTFLTCLTFRCCLTTHLIYSDRPNFSSEDSILSEEAGENFATILSYDKEDMKEFSFDFFQNVECKRIQLTDEFVARFLEELPNHDVFGPFVQQIFKATMHSQGVLQLWKHPHSAKLLSKMQLECLHESAESTPTDFQSIDNEFESSHTEFQPLDTFLDDLKHQQTGVNVGSVGQATMQHTILEYGKENLKHIAC